MTKIYFFMCFIFKMIINLSMAKVFALFNFVYLVSSAVPNNKDICYSKLATCEKNIAGKRPVCGTDNQTYMSRCHLLKNQCQGFPVSVKHKGPCHSNAQPCFVSRNYALSLRTSDGEEKSTFVPRCRPDGTYAAIQCHEDTGCWCVTPAGKPLQNTSVRNGRPNCDITGKSFTRRRSSVRGQGNRKNYERSHTLPTDADRTRFVLEWKFSELDKNGDNVLDKPEYRGLRRLVKKVVKPKKCARSFTKVCDVNQDASITKLEWISCLTGDGLNYYFQNIQDCFLRLLLPYNHNVLFRYTKRHMSTQGINRQKENEHEEDYNFEEETSAVLPGSLIKAQFPELEDPSERNRDETETNDCLTDRKIVLEEQKSGDVLYVPECMSDGRYQRVQCYHSVGYCWCVHEDTGKPIPGSSVKDQRPTCDLLPTLQRPMKGCPEPAKSKFLKDLMSFLISKMTTSANSTTGITDILKWQASKEEQVATWTFVMLDKDKNKMLDRPREWKSFHTLITANPTLKKCGRKLPRFCDVNNDRRISITEWLQCLDAQRSPAVGTSTLQPQIPTPAQRRKGPNPLESILKADD